MTLFASMYEFQRMPQGRIRDTSAIIRAMPRCFTGANPLPEPVISEFTDIHQHYQAWLS